MVIPYGSTGSNNSGQFQLNSLTPGATYFWTKSAHDTSLTVGSTTLTSSGLFVAPASGSVTLNGTPGGTVTASVNAEAGQINFSNLGKIGSLLTFMPTGTIRREPANHRLF